MDSRNKRISKLLGLLLSALMIGIASAYQYNMFMNATVGVTPTGMSFVAAAGTDFTTCGGSITSNKMGVTFSSMNGYPDVEAIWNPVEIHCADSAGDNIELTATWDGASQTNLYYIKVTMYNGATQQGATIVLYPTSEGTSVTTTGPVPIANGGAWTVQWKVYWKASALNVVDIVHVNLQLAVASP